MRVLTICALFLLSTSYVFGYVVVYTKDKPPVIVDEFMSQPAEFGGTLPRGGLRGRLVIGDPRDGCSVIDLPRDVKRSNDKTIALLARYGCSFDAKVRAAQTAGFDAVIVHNVNSSDLEIMLARNAEGITIPAVFVGDHSGAVLADNYNNDEYDIVLKGAEQKESTATESPLVLFMMSIVNALLFSSS